MSYALGLVIAIAIQVIGCTYDLSKNILLVNFFVIIWLIYKTIKCIGKAIDESTRKQLSPFLKKYNFSSKYKMDGVGIFNSLYFIHDKTTKRIALADTSRKNPIVKVYSGYSVDQMIKDSEFLVAIDNNTRETCVVSDSLKGKIKIINSKDIVAAEMCQNDTSVMSVKTNRGNQALGGSCRRGHVWRCGFFSRRIKFLKNHYAKN